MSVYKRINGNKSLIYWLRYLDLTYILCFTLIVKKLTDCRNDVCGKVFAYDRNNFYKLEKKAV